MAKQLPVVSYKGSPKDYFNSLLSSLGRSNHVIHGCYHSFRLLVYCYSGGENKHRKRGSDDDETTNSAYIGKRKHFRWVLST